MATIRQKAFPPGRYRVGGALVDFPREELAEYVAGTRAAMAAGIAMPLLKKHAPPGADDDATKQFSATDGAGWLKGIEQDADGALDLELDVPDEIAADIKAGKIKFTSPEFRTKYIDGKGRDHGKVIRHVCFTPLPRNPDQGPFVAVAMGECIQCSDSDYEGPAGAKDGEAPRAKNPDMPPKATDSTKLSAVIAGLNQKGIVVPSDFDFTADSAIDVLLAAINSSIKAEQEAKAEKEKPVEPNVKESQSMPFSEQEISSLPPALQEKARKANQEAAQFAEERTKLEREKGLAAVKAIRLPKGLHDKLVEKIGSVQFSETGESPTLTIQQAAKLFADAIPPSLRFDEEDVHETEHPDGDKFFKGDAEPSAEQAEKIARQAHSRDKAAA